MGSEMVGIRERQIGNLTPLCKKKEGVPEINIEKQKKT